MTNTLGLSSLALSRPHLLMSLSTRHNNLFSVLGPGSNRNSRGSQLESSHDVWESRSSAARERSVERSNDRSAAEKSSERGSDRDRYESDRRGEPFRDSSYDRRGGHGERDRRDNRDRGEERSSWVEAARIYTTVVTPINNN